MQYDELQKIKTKTGKSERASTTTTTIDIMRSGIKSERASTTTTTIDIMRSRISSRRPVKVANYKPPHFSLVKARDSGS